jgi:cytochrome c peroxidase
VLRRKTILFFVLLIISVQVFTSFKKDAVSDKYTLLYENSIKNFIQQQQALIDTIENCNGLTKKIIKHNIHSTRLSLKAVDFWLRYLEPISYKKINGPLRIEWETEVFEKFEKPYKREGAGLTLAELYLDQKTGRKSELLDLIRSSKKATQVFLEDSITRQLSTKDHFFLCNRLHLLNLATIYTTGFDGPDTSRIIPELKRLHGETFNIYEVFNRSFPETPLSGEYLRLYESILDFFAKNSGNYAGFDHFTFIREYVNPLFAMNQEFIRKYKVESISYMDYTLNNACNSIFNKKLYSGQNTKGVFLKVYDAKVIAEIQELGKLLFYDPILSGNDRRSCASCHKQENYYTDNGKVTAFQFNEKDKLPRNTPSLINAPYNHLLMLDGKHISLREQGKAVITNSIELAGTEAELIKKLVSCDEYKDRFNKLLKFTPAEKNINIEHVVSALTMYYGKFSNYYSSFDNMMNGAELSDPKVKSGFNIFMGKGKCATCHFLPQFNGVKPPYVSSEFEVIGTPFDTTFKSISNDEGRYGMNPVLEMKNAFRTGSIRNSEKTAPYMHNGVFTRLEQVVDFYDAGGGVGKGMKVANQTLSTDSLHLTKDEKSNLILFMRSLTENIIFEKLPEKLPVSKNKNLNSRKVGGEY